MLAHVRSVLDLLLRLRTEVVFALERDQKRVVVYAPDDPAGLSGTGRCNASRAKGKRALCVPDR